MDALILEKAEELARSIAAEAMNFPMHSNSATHTSSITCRTAHHISRHRRRTRNITRAEFVEQLDAGLRQ